MPSEFSVRVDIFDVFFKLFFFGHVQSSEVTQRGEKDFFLTEDIYVLKSSGRSYITDRKPYKGLGDI